MAKVTLVEQALKPIKDKLNVAAYARVSMAAELTHHSFEAQIGYFRKLICDNDEWNYAGVYSDYGISGTATDKRDGFNSLLEDCKSGKIDMVLVKSISRFARNTLDCLETTRLLKSLGVAVYFEKENINSLSCEGELLLTLMASFAQEESRSISENVKWGIRKRFKEGEQNGFTNPFGYSWDGEMYRVVPEEGIIVKEIFARYIAGDSAYAIAKDLAKRGITGRKGSLMEQTTVKGILDNISYTGRQLLQKKYVSESHKIKLNDGKLASYLVEEMFEPLVSDADFKKVAEIRRARAPKVKPKLTRFSGKIKCGNCGSGVSRRSAGAGKKRWICNTRERKGMAECDMRPIMEYELERLIGNIPFKQITVFGDRLEVSNQNGNIKRFERCYSGIRGNNPFTRKVWCQCGAICIRANWHNRKIWVCSECGAKTKIAEEELRKLCVDILGENYQGKVVEMVSKLVIEAHKIIFTFKDGSERIWQRP